MPRPMPSPNGTNFERLTMPGPAAAYDAAMSDGAKQRVTDFLSGKLTDVDMEKIKRMIAEEDGGPDDDDDAPVAQQANDAAYRTKVRDQYARGQITYDHMQLRLQAGPPPREMTAGQSARFDAMFPDAKRIRHA